MLRVLDASLSGGRQLSATLASSGQLNDAAAPLSPSIPFGTLPTDVAAKRGWSTLSKRQWKYEDFIALGEGRATVKLCHMLSRCSSSHNLLVMSLQDNTVTACAHSKGRSSSLPVNYLCRRRAALCLASNIRLIFPWLESALPPADNASRN